MIVVVYNHAHLHVCHQVSRLFRIRNPQIFGSQKPLSIKVVPDKGSHPPYDKSKPAEMAFLVHALDFTSSFLYLFPPKMTDKPFNVSWWMYLVTPISVLFHMVVSLLVKPLGLQPFVVLDR